ncbi:MAG TPA: sensor histidine kinase [Nitrospiraceae bacterium]|nr:sensor histidine kinase [Nitrospiraceae bacterium]
MSQDISQNQGQHERLLHHLGERVKELTALHGVVRLLQDSRVPLDEVLHQVVLLLPPAWQYPDIAVARIRIEGVVATTPRFRETPWMQRASLTTSAERQGSIEVGYLEEKPEEYEGPFLVEERNLLNSLADSLSSYLTRREAEEGLRDTHAQLQALSRQLMHLQEQERRQLAHDLHDEVGQALTALKMNLQTMERVADLAPVQPSLHDSFGILDTLLARVRDLSLDLRPSLLDHLGLVPAIRWYAIRQAERAGLQVHVEADSLPEDLAADRAVVCFRIVQEAVTNVLRHAKATQLDVVLQTSDSGFTLIVKDNGVGFRTSEFMTEVEGRWTIGLVGMRERARALGGHLKLHSAPGRGTEVFAHIPWRQRGQPDVNNEVG